MRRCHNNIVTASERLAALEERVRSIARVEELALKMAEKIDKIDSRLWEMRERQQDRDSEQTKEIGSLRIRVAVLIAVAVGGGAVTKLLDLLIGG